MAQGGLKGTLSGSGASQVNPSTASGSVSVAVGDLVYVVFGQQTNLTVGTGSTNPSDNLGNTYAWCNAGTDPGTPTARAGWSIVTNAGTLTSVSAPATASTNDYANFAAVIEGPFMAAASQPIANPANSTNNISSPFTCPSTGTLPAAHAVVMAFFNCASSATFSATSPNLLAGQANNSTNVKVVIGYQKVAATTAVAPEFTGTNPTGNSVLGTTAFILDIGGSLSRTLGTLALSASESAGGFLKWGADKLVWGTGSLEWGAPASPGLAAGVGAASAIGSALGIGAGTASASGHVAGVGSSNALAVGSASGSSSASAVGGALATAAGAASGQGNASASGSSIATAAGYASGVGDASAQSRTVTSADGLASGSGAAAAVGQSYAMATGLATASGSASGASNAIVSADGSATASSSATADGSAIAAAIGSASGSGTTAAYTGGLFIAVGAAAASAAAVALGQSLAEAYGFASGESSADGPSAAIALAVGNANGTGAAAGAGAETDIAGASVGGAYVTAEELDRIRRYWRELEEAQEAPRKARKALESRLGETLERAYARISRVDDGANDVFAPVLAIKKPNLPRRVAPDDIAHSVDWTAAARQLDIVAQLIDDLDARLVDVDDRAAEAIWIARDEEDIEMLLLAAEF